MGWVVNATPRPLYPKDGSHCRGGWARKISLPPLPGVRSSDCLARSDSLYRLRNPGPRKNSRGLILSFRRNVEPNLGGWKYMRGSEKKVQRKIWRSAIDDVKKWAWDNHRMIHFTIFFIYLYYDAFYISDCVVLNVTTRDFMISNNKFGMTLSWPNGSNNSAPAWRAGLDQEKPVSIIGVFPRFEPGPTLPTQYNFNIRRSVHR